MNDIENQQRAQITAMLIRVISELAGGDPGIDEDVGRILSGVIEVCHRSKVKGSPRVAQAALQTALDLVTNEDWLLTVKKTGQVFELEARFGAEVQPLQSVHGDC